MNNINCKKTEITRITEASMGGWLDAIDNAETEADVYAIPEWALEQAGVSRSSLLSRVRGSNSSSSYSKPKYQSTPGKKPSGPTVDDAQDPIAAKQFWDNAKQDIIDYENFHKAYGYKFDDPSNFITKYFSFGYNKERTLDRFELKDKRVWQHIKELDPNLASTKAIKKIWGLRYSTPKPAYSVAQLASFKKQQFVQDVATAIKTARPESDLKHSVYAMGGGLHIFDDGKITLGYSGSEVLNIPADPYDRTVSEVADEIMTAWDNSKYSKKYDYSEALMTEYKEMDSHDSTEVNQGLDGYVSGKMGSEKSKK